MKKVKINCGTQRFSSRIPLVKVFAVFIFLLYSGITSAQTCNICSQDDVDNWTQVFSNALYISGNDITNLDGMSELDFSLGNVWIYDNPNLTNINGLTNFRQAGGSVQIYNNPLLEKIVELPKFEGCFGLEIRNNSSLDTINLPSYVDNRYRIKNNASLLFIDISSSLNLERVEVSNNPILSTIVFPSDVTTIDSVTIVNNGSLTNIDALSKLTTFTQGIKIQDNSLLKDFCGLYSIIVNNPIAIPDISGNLKNPLNQEIIGYGSCGNFKRNTIGYETLQEALASAEDYDFIHVARDFKIETPFTLSGEENYTLVVDPTIKLTFDAPFTNEGIIINHGTLHMINNNPFINQGSIIVTGSLISE